MSASQPLSLVTDYGELSSANATSAVTSASVIKTGILYVVCSDDKAAGHKMMLHEDMVSIIQERDIELKNCQQI